METTGKNGRRADGRILARLFYSMFMISAFTFGGGYVIVTLMKKKFVDEQGLMTEQEMLDYTALAQSCPGAIAVNAAILAGWRVAGFAGMLCAVAGTVMPPLIILTVISLFYSAFASNSYVAMLLSGMQAGVAAVLTDVVLSMGRNVLAQHSMIKTAIMIAAFIAVYVFGVSVIAVILGAAVIGTAAQRIAEKGEGRA